MKHIFFIVTILSIHINIVFAALSFTVFTDQLESDTADLTIPFSFETGEFDIISASLSFQVEVIDEENTVIHQQTKTQFISTKNNAAGSFKIRIQQPKIWYPENPNHYTAKLSVFKRATEIENHEVIFGIRKLGIDHNSWRLNDLPVKLKGVVYQYHTEYWQRDLILMQQAHINAIRIDGSYPPKAFLSACDAMGFMVITSPQDTMKSKALVSPHPSIIAWELHESAELEIKYSKLQLIDPSRTVIAANHPNRTVHTWMIDTPVSLPPSEWLQRKSKPLVLLREPTVDGGRMEGIEEAIAVMNSVEYFAGFFIHRFAGDENESGLVTAERTITANYKEVQKVFSPIQIDQDEAEIKAGENYIELDVHNHFQQINVSETTCQWVLIEDNKVIQNGSLYLNIPPQESFGMEIECSLPDEIDCHIYFLQINYFVGEQLFHRHVVRLLPDQWKEKLLLRLDDLSMDEEWTVDTSVEGSEFLHEGFVFKDQSPNAGWFLMTQDGHVRLITDGPFVVSNEGGLYHQQINDSASQSVVRDFWVTKRDVNRRGKNIVVESSMMNQTIAVDHSLNLTSLFSPFGFMDVKYELNFDHLSPSLYGLAFRLSPTLNRFQYVGKGPYPSYPGKRALNDFGIFSFVDWGTFVPGNRERVTLAAFTGKHGYGLGIMMLNGNVSVLPSDEGALVSINAAVAGLGNKNWDTQYPINRDNAPRNGYSAAFRLIPLTKNQYPELFESTFKN